MHNICQYIVHIFVAELLNYRYFLNMVVATSFAILYHSYKCQRDSTNKFDLRRCRMKLICVPLTYFLPSFESASDEMYCRKHASFCFLQSVDFSLRTYVDITSFNEIISELYSWVLRHYPDSSYIF